ncbi:MAG: radical SAM protein [Gammaproteobacteria bacterium]|jgi:radical SAM superfamily enzyme YgiQ (UPF0313 family)
MSPLKIALISPKGPLYRYRNGIFKKSLRYAPLTLTTLASLTPDEVNPQFQLYDEGVEDVPLDIDADIVGMTVITGTAPRAYELAKHYRERGITVVLGGPHVTLLPEEAQQHADTIVSGYAEQSWPALIRDFEAGKLLERYTQDPDLKLQNLPFPRRDLLDAKKFLTMDVFEATRSCNHACNFCVAPAAWGRKPYQKPVDYVVDDIRRQNAKKIIFIDLNLISDRKYAARLFEALIPCNISWFGLATSLIMHDRELLKLMARSGCTGLLIGFESISKDNLRSSNKRFNTPDQYADLISLLHRYGISVMGCFVFGMDYDNEQVFDETARFVVDTHIDLPRFAIATPFPGTPFFARLEREQRILTHNWELYDGQHVVFQPSQMAVETLQKGHERTWKSAYRWRSMAKRIAGSRTQIPISIIANLGYRYYANHLHDFYNCDWYIGQRDRPAKNALAERSPLKANL